MPSFAVVQRAQGKLAAALIAWCLLALAPAAPAQAQLAAPELEAPADAATGVSVTPTLSWKKVEGAKGYQVQGESGTEWKVLIWSRHVAERSVVVGPLLPSTKYHWRVRAFNNEGVSPWSKVFYFVTGTEVPQLGAPVLQSPANHSVGMTHPAKLTWLPVLGATGYYVAVSTTTDFAVPVFTAAVPGTMVEVPGLAKNTMYFWKVLARHEATAGPWSEIWKFTTADADRPPAPLLHSPPNGSLGVPVRVPLVWKPVAGAIAYQVQVSAQFGFNPLTWVTNVDGTKTTVTTPELPKGAKFYWRVLVKTAAGYSPWSVTWWFQTAAGELPGVPVLHLPVNGATGQSTTPTLSWLAVAGATGYYVQVSTSQAFEPSLVNKYVTSTSTEVSGLAPGTKYYWRVAAKNANGVSAFSKPWYFVTSGVERPAVPVLYSPANGAVDVPVNTPLIWLASARATGYVVQVSLTTDFAKVLWAQEVVGGATGAHPLGLAAGTTYFWRVKAVNNIGPSDWSTIWRFKTKGAGGS